MGTKVLIVGAGIAGPTTAYWLSRFGFEPTLVERAPALRHGGYVIDFWGAAFGLAERMGVLAALQQHGYRVEELRIVGDDGHTVGGFDAGVFERLTDGRYLTVARSTLSRALYERLDDRVEKRFGTTIRALEQHADAVDVQFEDGSEERFDLVIGADGQHSRVRDRRKAFDCQSRIPGAASSLSTSIKSGSAYRADQSRTRQRLGLSFVKAIIEAHGGSVSATSTPGRGSTFSAVLPARI